MITARLRPTLAVAVATAAVCAAPAAGAGPKTYSLRVGQLFTADGQTGTLEGKALPATGVVVVRARWVGAAWRVLLRTRTDAKGRYHFKFRPQRRGTLSLRIEPPDHVAQRLVLKVR